MGVGLDSLPRMIKPQPQPQRTDHAKIKTQAEPLTVDLKMDLLLSRPISKKWMEAAGPQMSY